MTLSPTLRAELAKLDDAEILEVLGHIVDASIDTPFKTSENFDDAMFPVSEAYRQAYSSMDYVASGEHARDNRSDGTMSSAQESAWERSQDR